MDRITAKFKVSHRYPFFDTQTLTFPFALEIPDPGNDLARELQLFVTYSPYGPMADVSM